MMLKYYYYVRRNYIQLATYDHESDDAPLVFPASGMGWFQNQILIGKTLPRGPEEKAAANPMWFDGFVENVKHGREGWPPPLRC